MYKELKLPLPSRSRKLLVPRVPILSDTRGLFLPVMTPCGSAWLTLPDGLSGCLYKNWQPVMVDEMQGFVGVIMNMGIIQLSNLKDYWSTDDTMDLLFFCTVFSRNCFVQILGAFHVGDPDSTLK